MLAHVQQQPVSPPPLTIDTRGSIVPPRHNKTQRSGIACLQRTWVLGLSIYLLSWGHAVWVTLLLNFSLTSSILPLFQKRAHHTIDQGKTQTREVGQYYRHGGRPNSQKGAQRSNAHFTRCPGLYHAGITCSTHITLPGTSYSAARGRYLSEMSRARNTERARSLGYTAQ